MASRMLTSVTLFLFSAVILSEPLLAQSRFKQTQRSPVCVPADTAPQPNEEGYVLLPADRGISPQLHWMRIKSKTQPPKGIVFYLAGGPWPTYPFLPLAAAFQEMSFPDKDVILYDYLGTNCSAPLLQNAVSLKPFIPHLTIEGMARDFIALKKELVGDSKVALIGGSFGAMLGAQIIATYPDSVEKAALFSGDLTSDWLANGWLRFDNIIQTIGLKKPKFSQDMQQLLDNASVGFLKIKAQNNWLVLTREDVETMIWLFASQNSAEQLQLPDLVAKALTGETAWLEKIYVEEYRPFVDPLPVTPPPTTISAVTNFYRCNVFHTKSARLASLESDVDGRFLKLKTLARIWDQACKDYDELGEFPSIVKPRQITNVPVLSWVGDQDMFDPIGSKYRFQNLSSVLRFEIIPGWSHDFGPEPNIGISKVGQMIKDIGL